MKKFISIFFLILLIAESSCKKNFLSLENNPNTPSVASPELLLAAALKQTASITNGTGYTMYAGWVGFLTWSTGFQANTALLQYVITTSTYDVWTPLYLNISNYSALMTANGGANYTAIAKIMTVFDYEALVDNYNNVPYTQATKGTSNLAPVYDNGSAIYDDLLVQLDAAIKLIQGGTSAVMPGSGDIMYKGNMGNWMKFANTLKLRIALRQSNLTAKTTALKASVAATQSLGYIDATNPGSVNPGYFNSDANGGQQSPINIAYGVNAAGASSGNNAPYQASAYGAHFYGKNNDPRLIQIYSASTSFSTTPVSKLVTSSLLNASVDSLAGKPYYGIVSTPLGSFSPPSAIIGTGTRANLSVSKYGPGVLKTFAQNANVLSAAESLFLQAEGAARGYISGDAATFYKAGITASFVDDLVGGTPASPNASAATNAAADYYGQAKIAYPTAGSLETQVQAIVFQKWAALNLYGAFEAFNELRRTGYPDDIPTSIYPGANAPNQVTRIPYPIIEYNTNANSVAAQGTINVFTSKIFWAK